MGGYDLVDFMYGERLVVLMLTLRIGTEEWVPSLVKRRVGLAVDETWCFLGVTCIDAGCVLLEKVFWF